MLFCAKSVSTQRVGRFALLFLCLAASGIGCAPEPAPAPASRQAAPQAEKAARPNVVFLLLDTLRADRIHAKRNGHPVMPGLAALAAEGWAFRNCVSQATWTKPSMTTMFTGLYPQVHRVQFGLQKRMLDAQEMTVDVVPEAYPMLAEWLQAAGYRTGAVQSNAHLKPEYGFARGFHQYNTDGGRAEVLTDRALAMAQTFEAPYFLYVHYMDAHGPYEAAEPYFSRFGELPPLTPEERAWFDDPDLRRRRFTDALKYFAGLSDSRKYPPLSKNMRRHIIQRYDSECRYLDEHVARLITALAEQHPNTIFIVKADHGEEFWEHGWFGHGTTVYHEVAHVPFIMRVPGETPRAIDSLVRSIDLAPTLAGLLDIAPLEVWQGRSLAPAARGLDTPTPPALTNTRASLRELGINKGAYTTMTGKLIIHRDEERVEMFDLAEDPAEQDNLADARPEAVARYRADFERFLGKAMACPAAEVPTERVPLDMATREQLEALGYLGGLEEKAE